MQKMIRQLQEVQLKPQLLAPTSKRRSLNWSSTDTGFHTTTLPEHSSTTTTALPAHSSTTSHHVVLPVIIQHPQKCK